MEPARLSWRGSFAGSGQYNVSIGAAKRKRVSSCSEIIRAQCGLREDEIKTKGASEFELARSAADSYAEGETSTQVGPGSLRRRGEEPAQADDIKKADTLTAPVIPLPQILMDEN